MSKDFGCSTLTGKDDDMYKLDKYKFGLGLFFTSLFAVTQNQFVILAYFLVLFCQEFYYMTKFRHDKMIQQILMSIPLMGITVVHGFPLGNVYIAFFALYLLFIYRKIGLKKSKFFVFIFFIYADLLRWSIFSDAGFNAVGITSIPILYLCIFAGISAFEETSRSQLMNAYIPSFIEGVVLSVLYGAITRFLAGGFVNIFVNKSILNRNEGASGDPNYFGLYICLAVAMLIFLMMEERSYSVLNYLSAFLLLLFGLSSSSRMFYIIALVLIIMLLFVFVIQIFKGSILPNAFILLVLGLALFVTKDIFFSNINYLLTRFEMDNISQLTSGRSDLLGSYVEFTNSAWIRMLFGIGIAQYNIRSGIGAYAHNMYIEFYVTLGLIGSVVLLVIGIIFLLNNLMNRNRKHFTIWTLLPLAIIGIGGFGVNFLEVDSFYMLMSLVFAIVTINDKEKRVNEINWLDDYQLNTKYWR